MPIRSSPTMVGIIRIKAVTDPAIKARGEMINRIINLKIKLTTINLSFL